MDKLNNLHTPPEHTLRSLVDEYFEGMISPTDLNRLVTLAEKYLSEQPHDLDRQLESDVKSILAIEKYSKASISLLESRTPADLENKLDAHISKLASRSVIRWRWLKAGSAAACAALLLTVGIRQFHTGNVTPGEAEIPTIYIAGTTEKETPKTASPLPLPTITAPEPVQASLRNQTARTIPSNRAMDSQPEYVYIPEQVTNPSIADITASLNLPDILPSIQEIVPMIAEATVNPAQLVVQPFTTLSQAFDNVFESIATVNSAIMGANETFEVVSDELAKISSTPLHAI